MDNASQTRVYVGSGILFLLPCLLLYFSWRSLFRHNRAPMSPAWRKHCVEAALLVAVLATILHIAWNASWLHSGGSPHGMRASPGLWLSLSRPLLWSFGIAVALSLLAKGRGRVLLVTWSLSMVFVFYAIYMLQID